MELAEDFTDDEARCSCGCEMPAEVQNNCEDHSRHLQIIRDRMNAVDDTDDPLFVTSWYRCPAHNAAVGGASSSEHLYGRATDLKRIGWSSERVRGFLEALIAVEEIPEGGIGSYEKHPGMVHYDSRGTRARWHYTMTG